MLKVLALNASPKMDQSNTALILNPFLEGLKEGGAQVELLHIRNLHINSCTGEFHCWVKQPGQCYQQDDMQHLYPKLRQADILVLATPVYVDGIAGPLKTLLDRTIPLVKPFFELRDGHCRHPLGEGTKPGKLVLVANCGFWELDNFDPLLVHINAVGKNMNREFAGGLLRPHGPALVPMKKMGLPIDDVFEAAKDAGHQLITEGKMLDNTLKIVSRELMPLERYVKEINKSFRRALDSR